MEFVFAGKRRVTVSRALRTSAAEQALFEGDDEGSTLATFVLDCLQRFACPLRFINLPFRIGFSVGYKSVNRATVWKRRYWSAGQHRIR